MNTLSQITRFVKPQNLLSLVLIAIVVGLLNIAALYAVPVRSGYRASNDPQTMRRESGPVSYLVALDASLQYGDCRVIDWNRVQWA
jgi:hypothetical protein